MFRSRCYPFLVPLVSGLPSSGHRGGVTGRVGGGAVVNFLHGTGGWTLEVSSSSMFLCLYLYDTNVCMCVTFILYNAETYILKGLG